ncbi:MAG: SdpI family protein [Candidatus Doudnabacteria bacterium]|nr:SdpI family protein [Candidatus Doudnabacteria bacterium]
MRLTKSSWYVLALCAVSIGISIAGYMTWPQSVPIHWNFAGQADGYASAVLAALLYPGMLLAMFGLFRVLPSLDPNKERYAEFEQVYELFMVAIITVFFLINVAAAIASWGYPVPIRLIVPGAVGVLFIVLGNYMGKLKRNYFVGVRTPWTLASENVWLATQRFSGKLFVVCGLLFFLIPFLPQTVGIGLFVVCIAAMVFGSFVYSYMRYREEGRE